MANINDIMLQASELQPGISRLLRNSTYPRYDDLSGRSMREELRIAHVVRFVFSAGRTTAPI